MTKKYQTVICSYCEEEEIVCTEYKGQSTYIYPKSRFDGSPLCHKCRVAEAEVFATFIRRKIQHNRYDIRRHHYHTCELCRATLEDSATYSFDVPHWDVSRVSLCERCHEKYVYYINLGLDKE